MQHVSIIDDKKILVFLAQLPILMIFWPTLDRTRLIQPLGISYVYDLVVTANKVCKAGRCVIRPINSLSWKWSVHLGKV